MFLGFVCPLLMILDGLMVWRLRRKQVTGALPDRESSPRERWLGGLFVLLAEFPLLYLVPPGIPEKLWGDAETHARVGRDLALHGLGSGWLDGLLAGFPLAQHYPPLPWLTLALEISLGLSPIRAIQWLGWLSLALAPLVVYWCLVQIPRVSAIFAALGAIFFAWISPYNEFFGGYEAFFSTGLISQVLGLPFVLLWMGSVVRGARTTTILVWSALAAASHPQLSVAGVLFLGAGLLALGRIATLKTFLWGSTALVAFAVGLYGQGVSALRVPFGWPENFGWRHIGFPASRLVWWLEDGDLFDQHGTGVLTPLLIALVLLALPRLKEPIVRASVFALCVGLLLSVSGPTLPKLGPLGALALKFIQPLRFVALLAPAAALVVTVVLSALARDLGRLLGSLGRPRCARSIRPALGLGILVLLVPAVPARLDFARGWPTMLRNFKTPAGYESQVISEWIARPNEGRIWYDVEDEEMIKLFSYDALSLRTTRLIGTTAAVGGHVGVLLAASPRIQPGRAGSERRAEALGIRNLLYSAESIPEGWRVIERSGTMSFLGHNRPTNLSGVGCITRRYSGSNASLSKRLYADLRDDGATDRILDPESLVELAWAEGELREAEVERGPCSAEGARVREFKEPPGHFRASIETVHPVDVVIRAAYFPSFQVRLDGARQTFRVVAPGFLSIRVPAGRHEVTAEAAVWAGMGSSLTVSALALLLLGLGRSSSARARLRSLASSGRSRVSTRPSV